MMAKNKPPKKRTRVSMLHFRGKGEKVNRRREFPFFWPDSAEEWSARREVGPNLSYLEISTGGYSRRIFGERRLTANE
jgi:hypothetical protein